MTFEFFRFELRQQLRAPLLWLMALMFGLFAFGASSSDAVVVGNAVGNVDRNAPTVIVRFLGMFTILGLLVIVSFISGALLRDFELGTADLFFSSPMRKRDFLLGRFLAAVAACMVIYLVVAVGLMVGPTMPWVDPERLGPFSLVPYAWGFAVIVIPNLLFSGALLALLAVTTRSVLVVYLGVIGFFILNSVAGVLTGDLDNVWLATLVDPLGMTALDRTTRYWSADQINRELPELTGYLLANRVLWVALSVALVAAAFALFKPQRAGTGRGWSLGRFGRRKPQAAPTLDGGLAQVSEPADVGLVLRHLAGGHVHEDGVGPGRRERHAQHLCGAEGVADDIHRPARPLLLEEAVDADGQRIDRPHAQVDVVGGRDLLQPWRGQVGIGTAEGPEDLDGERHARLPCISDCLV